MNKGPWQVQSSRRVYKDDFIELKVDEVVGPDRSPRTYSTVEVKPGVAILAIDSDDHVYLTKQFRYAINKDSLEVVCGGIDDGMDPLSAAKKELREEIGLEADEWSEIGTIDMDTSNIHCPIHLFAARGLTDIGSNQEGTEEISYFKVSLEEVVKMVTSSAITHAASCVLIMRAHEQTNPNSCS